MLAKSTLMGSLYPGSINWAIETDDRINPAVRADRSLSGVIAITPLGNRAGRELGEAVVADRYLTSEERSAMH